MARNTRTQDAGVIALTADQDKAISLLIEGKTPAEVAKAAGITTRILRDWQDNEPAFIAELNHRRSALWESHRDSLRAVLGKAVQVLCEDLESEDGRLRQAAAIHILRAAGMYGGDLTPTGHTTPEAVEKQKNQDRILQDLMTF